MEIGYCPEHVMDRAVYKQLHKRRADVDRCLSVRYPAAAVRPSGDFGRLILRSETLSGEVGQIGRMIVDRVAAGLLEVGAEPAYMTLSVQMPETSEERELRTLIRMVDEGCGRYDTDIVDAQVCVTPAVKHMTVTLTAAGFGACESEDSWPHDKTRDKEHDKECGKEPANEHVKGQNLQQVRMPRPGDAIVMTGYAGYAGAGRIADVRAKDLHKRYHPDFIDQAADYLNHLSMAKVIGTVRDFGCGESENHGILHPQYQSPKNQKNKKSQISQSLFVCGAGGVFGALWRLAKTGDVGFDVDMKKILLKQQIVEICDYFDINPYMLDAQGAMLVCTDRGEALARVLEDAGYPAAVIGLVKEGHDKCLINEDEVRHLDMPRGDEAAKLLM